MSKEMREELLRNMNIQGYRAYRYRGGIPDRLFLEIVRYIGLPDIIFVKDKINKIYG